MWLFLFAFASELHAKNVHPGKWPQPVPDLPRWVRHPEDWPDPPTIPPPDPRVIKFKANVQKLLRSVKHANSTKQQWQVAASIDDKHQKRRGLVLLSRRSSNAIIEKQPLSGLRDPPPPQHFHDSQEMLKQVKGFESHLAGLKGSDDVPDEFTWKNLSLYKPHHPFNSTFWVILCGDHGKHAVGIWKDVCKTSYYMHHVRFRKTICSSDVKAIMDIENEDECSSAVAKDAECSNVFHYINDKSSKECKCVLKDKVCAPADNDKGTVFWIEK